MSGRELKSIMREEDIGAPADRNRPEAELVCMILGEAVPDIVKKKGIKELLEGDGQAGAGASGEARTEGCSCIWGNPCEDQYICQDWANRFDVAKKNGWPG